MVKTAKEDSSSIAVLFFNPRNQVTIVTNTAGVKITKYRR